MKFASKLLSFLVAGALTVSASLAQTQGSDAVSGTYVSDPQHRYITFSYNHLGYSRPYIRWRDWEGTLEWNADNPESSTISVVIDATSVDSGVDVFDDHLSGSNLFDVENHSEITFVGTSINPTDETTGTITGDLTIKGITKPVTLDVTFRKGGFESRWRHYKLGFSATTTVNRSDFDLAYFVPAVSDAVDIVIEAEFILPVEATE